MLPRALALALSIGVDARTPIQAGDSDEPGVAGNDVNALVTTAQAQRPMCGRRWPMFNRANTCQGR